MRRGWVLVLAGTLLLAPWPPKAAEQERQEEQMETRQQEQQAYGWQLMTRRSGWNTATACARPTRSRNGRRSAPSTMSR